MLALRSMLRAPIRLCQATAMTLSTASNVARKATSLTNKATGVQLVYSTRPNWPYPASKDTDESSTVDVAILDSSFNPPSKAHLALCLSPPILASSSGKQHYDAHLLLFSTQNADKGSSRPGDPSLSQRVEMMTLMAKEMERSLPSSNVAVGLVDKPLIFQKSTLTIAALPPGKARLHWVVGSDTLYRVFQLKYYPSPEEFQRQCRQFFEEEGTTLVCARRDQASFPQLGGEVKEEEAKLLSSEKVKAWVEKRSVGMLDIDPEKAALSSTSIRNILKDQAKRRVEKQKELETMVPPLLVDYLLDSGES